MERVEMSIRALASIDSDTGFDLIWVDGSNSQEARSLPDRVKLSNTRLVEVHRDVKGGPDAAIQFGLTRLLALGYDYCGLIENDIELSPGWFNAMMSLFTAPKADGIRVGAVTARTFASRVMAHTPSYALMWNAGAGMILFSRLATQVVLRNYRLRTSCELAQFFKERLGHNLQEVWELWEEKDDRILGADWGYTLELYRHGLATVGTKPSMAFNFDIDAEILQKTHYTRKDETGDNSSKEAIGRIRSRNHVTIREKKLLMQIIVQDWITRSISWLKTID